MSACVRGPAQARHWRGAWRARDRPWDRRNAPGRSARCSSPLQGTPCRCARTAARHEQLDMARSFPDVELQPPEGQAHSRPARRRRPGCSTPFRCIASSIRITAAASRPALTTPTRCRSTLALLIAIGVAQDDDVAGTDLILDPSIVTSALPHDSRPAHADGRVAGKATLPRDFESLLVVTPSQRRTSRPGRRSAARPLPSTVSA